MNIEFALLVFTSFISIVNPIGAIPQFLSLTEHYDETKRRKTARKASVTLFVALISVAFIGEYVFSLFNITINGLRIVGGLLFLEMGREMIRGKNSKSKKASQSEISQDHDEDISITPLGFPILCGPGAITTAMVLKTQASTVILMGIFIAVIAVVSLLTWLILFSGTRIQNKIGQKGSIIMTRIMGLIVMIIAVEFIIAGLKPFLLEIFKEITL